MLALMRAYPIEDVLREHDRLIVWKTAEGKNQVLVKAWRRSCWGDETLESPRLAKFCEDAEDFILTQPAGLNHLIDVGWLGHHLALVQEYVDAYTESQNPPILHRKETFLDPLHPRFAEYAQLSAREEELELLSRNDIGTRRGWEELLHTRGLRLEGTSIVPVSDSPSI
ncbi:hypothetical protein HDF16_000131 [Granulicella aggregans]|uniref:Uncharacterized protein n=1 Tax=Granulicella aggregans TaxID=474949 RepID=A0A7W7Z8Z2_9BACT|nr:hypothetical protein [Granulicella aggregans]MBB5055462.1 hypothetical protein [Granulicella aggregans]